MTSRIISLLLKIFTATAIPISAAANDLPWSAILIDVSGDICAPDNNGRSEKKLLTAFVDELATFLNDNDSVTVFGDGHAKVPFKVLRADSKHDFAFLRSCVGDGTRIYNAMLSQAATATGPQRILVVTNGLDRNSAFHPVTTSKILKDRGVTVDALCIYLPAESLKYDSLTVSKPELGDDFKKAIGFTGGNFKSARTAKEVRTSLKKLLKSAGGKRNADSSHDYGYDPALLEEALMKIAPEKRNVIETDTASVLRYNGVTFRGLNDVMSQAKSADRGVYVGIDALGYPTFDEYDSLYETRRYTNICFADSPEELQAKKQLMKSLKPGINYCKANADTPFDVLPLIYYVGEGDRMLVIGLEIVSEPH